MKEKKANKMDILMDTFPNEEDIEIESIEVFMKLAVSGKPFLKHKGIRIGILEVAVNNNFMDYVNGLVSGRCRIECKLGAVIKGWYYKADGMLLLIGKEGKAHIRIMSVSQRILFPTMPAKGVNNKRPHLKRAGRKERET